ncbi:MAG: hypothetical protein DRO40_01575 [Thermoprotei archaeon]|nr:MAG: hypothetical protein DRO40_01575 [Thermoprotei archaeon]
MVHDILDKIKNVKRILIPGPIEPHDDVKKSLQLPMISHRSEEFSELYYGIEKMVKTILYASKRDHVVMIPGSSILGLETVFINTIDTKTRVLLLKYGFFGEWMKDIVGRYTNNVDVIESPAGTVPDKSLVIDKIKSGGYDIIGLVHCETSTGVTLRYLRDIGKAARESGALLIIDGVSSVGAEEIRFDEWCIDAIVTGPQKAFGSPPGVSIVTLNERVLDRVNEISSRVRIPFYMELSRYVEYKVKYGWTVTTPPVNNVIALYTSLKKITNYGVDNYLEMHKNRALEVYRYAEEKGLKLFVKSPENRSYSVSVIEVNNAVDIVKKIKKEHGIIVASGLGELRDVVVRIGMMGFTPTEYIKEAIDILAKYTSTS